MTTGSGESRTLGGGPLFGDAQAAVSRGAAVPPGMSSADYHATSATVVPGGSAAPAPSRPVTVGASVARRRGRRARLTLKRIDPWSTLKFSLVYGIAGMIVLLVAVIVLYGVIDAMGVIDSLRSFLTDVSDSGNGPGLAAWLGFDRVLLVAFIVGLVNVVLFTAFATLTAFIYNVCTDIVGGVEVTLAERN